jgi:putative hemolysin
MSSSIGQIVLIVLLIVANGVFAMSEIAIISCRRTRLRQRVAEGDRRAASALELAEAPNRFLSTVQVGITLIGTLAGAIGGAGLAEALAKALALVPRLKPYALVLVVLGITYLSLVIGELVPKRLGLAYSEQLARAMAGTMQAFSVIASPVVRLLSWSTDAVLKLFRVTIPEHPPITEEELKILLDEGTEAGIFEEVEQDMVKRVLLLDDRRASALMTPRPEIVWLDADDGPEEIAHKLDAESHSRLPVAQGSLDVVLGEVRAKDLLSRCLLGESASIRDVLRQPLYVPETMPALRVLESFKQSGTQMALVIDEYGNLEGLVTLTDILEAIVGDIPEEDMAEEPEAVQREDGSWLIDGMLPIDELRELLQIEALPDEAQGFFQTLAGFVVMQFGDIPAVADHFEWGGYRYEVVDMDGPRVDKVLVVPLPQSEDETPQDDA